MSLPPALPSTRPERPRRRLLLVLAGVVGAFLVTTLGVLAYRLMQPRWFYAQVTIESGRPERGWWAFPPSALAPWGPTALLEILRKTEVLYPVIDQLDLTQASAREGARVTKHEAFSILLSSLRIEVDSRTPQVARVGIYDHDPERAANIVNMITTGFRNLQIEDEQDQLDRSPAQYSDEFLKQKATVREAVEQLRRMRGRDRITDPDAESPDAAVTGVDTAAYLAAKREYLQAKRILENAEAALSGSHREWTLNDSAIRILERAVPPAMPLPWWRGDPRPTERITVKH